MGKKLEVLTPASDRWDEFIDRLSGPDGVDFVHETSGWHWTCCGSIDRPKSVAILTDMGGIDVAATLHYFEQRGGHCDCEVVLNVDDRV